MRTTTVRILFTSYVVMSLALAWLTWREHWGNRALDATIVIACAVSTVICAGLALPPFRDRVGAATGVCLSAVLAAPSVAHLASWPLAHWVLWLQVAISALTLMVALLIVGIGKTPQLQENQPIVWFHLSSELLYFATGYATVGLAAGRALQSLF
jgi:hypothetical protein